MIEDDLLKLAQAIDAKLKHMDWMITRTADLFLLVVLLQIVAVGCQVLNALGAIR